MLQLPLPPRRLSSSIAVVLALSAGLLTSSFGDAASLYDNGVNDNANFTVGTPSAPLINGGHAVSDSFALSAMATVNSVTFALSTYASERSLPALDWAITSAPGGGTVFASGTSALTNVYLGTPPSTSTISDFSSTFSTGAVPLAAGTYWLTLQNAVSPTGSVDAYWDESDGPSQAYAARPSAPFLPLTPANFGGDEICSVPGATGDCSQSFAINGIPAISPVPEPTTWTMMLVGFGLIGGAARRRGGLSPV